jgi:hypothetical protein
VVVSTAYADFLASKSRGHAATGRDYAVRDVNPMLHRWQAELVTWACRVGRAAIWADTGLGKTFMQIEWARLMGAPGAAALIVAPLAVCQQTIREAAKLGVPAKYVRDGAEVDGPGLWVTNYEMVDRFDPAAFDAVVLDEASILKQSTGKTRTQLIRLFAAVPYRLACTATPAPNDIEELTSQAEFLGVMPRVEMLAAYFVHDSDTGWRVKGHARAPMFRWMASWAVAVRRPSDLGYPDDGYVLPGLEIVPHLLAVDVAVEGQLFATDLGGVGGRAKVRRDTLSARCERAAELVAAEPGEAWLLWAGLNDEAELMAKLTGAVNVHGAMSPQEKAELLLGFADGEISRIVTKPSVAAFGLNWQHCARMVFVGLSDSYEAYYQAIRRCYRYGQTRVVHAHLVLSELEAQIAGNVRRKEVQAAEVTAALVEAMTAARWAA